MLQASPSWSLCNNMTLLSHSATKAARGRVVASLRPKSYRKPLAAVTTMKAQLRPFNSLGCKTDDAIEPKRRTSAASATSNRAPDSSLARPPLDTRRAAEPAPTKPRVRRTKSSLPFITADSTQPDVPSTSAATPSNQALNSLFCRGLPDFVPPAVEPAWVAQARRVARNAARDTDGMNIQPAAADRERLALSVLVASLGHASGGSVPPELMVSEGNRIESVDIGGDAIFSRHADLVRTARKEVFIQTFAWEPTAPGAQTILDALVEAAENHKKSEEASRGEKLRVCLLINEGTGLAQKFMLMTAATRRRPAHRRWPSTPHSLVGNYRNDPQHKYAPLLQDIDFQVRVHQHASSNSMHSKSVVVDGAAAAVTGANVQARNHGDRPAYDFGITFRGDGAQGLREDFVSHWNSAGNPDQQTEPLPTARLTELAETGAPDAPAGVTMAILTRKPDSNLFNTGNDNPQNQAFMAAIANARNSIQVMTPNMNSPAVLKALANAADMGVRVQILLSMGFNDDRMNNMVAGGTNAMTIDKLKRMVRNHSALDIRYFRNPAHDTDSPPVTGNSPGASHVKFFAADDAIVIVGSANMDKTSWHFSAETNLALFGTEACQRIKSEVFDPVFEHSEPV
ncbi:MAG TPA: phosphatidylserine/phosphatidylglycerophosphate/cardiolipin synthase family protein [Burkholderiaceae bacterium]|nr:phosphatidylserine/phosphatidylglycerophosphate/cardiolipin synthase family protein [Burkholderiaceae bacterium]